MLLAVTERAEPAECPACKSAWGSGRAQCTCGYCWASGFVEPLPVDDLPVRERSYVKAAGNGSLIGGALLGFLCSCLGPLIAYGFGMGVETKRGSWLGFFVSIVISIIGEMKFGHLR